MNVIKTTENGGMYICTMIGINKELSEKMANWVTITQRISQRQLKALQSGS